MTRSGGGLNDLEQTVPDSVDGARLDRVVRDALDGASWSTVRSAIQSGKISLDGRRVTDPATPVVSGTVLSVRMAAPRPRGARSADLIVWVDRHLVVIRKPPGLSTVPYDERETNTVDELVRAELSAREGQRQPPLRVVQRLDKETSGLLVMARTLEARHHLANQLRVHSMLRSYRCIAAGQVRTQAIESRLVKDRGDGKRGSTRSPTLGRWSKTHVEALEVLAGATLCACRLETGRTHQIRIHLAEAGHPLLGERVYRPREAVGPDAPRVMLHATELGFVHPQTGETLRFEEPIPADMVAVRARLRAAGPAAD